jgi:hypothetical protein
MNNQTLEQWLMDTNAEDLGTGVFLAFDYIDFEYNLKTIFAVNSRHLKRTLTKIILSNCTYLDCIKYSETDGVLAFKWIPLKVSNSTNVKSQVDSCEGVLCVSRCAGFGCICIEGACR